jgi:phage terminase large subunit GpA-like protein
MPCAWIPNSAEKARAMWRSQWVPHPRQSVSEWAEANLSFSSRFTSSPGPFRVRSYPYMREWLDAFHPASGVRSMALLCGAQVAKSTAIQVGMAYRLCRAPAPALWVLDTQTNAQSFSESRWQVMIDDNELLRAELPANKDKFKNLDQAFRRMHLWFVGSNSPGNLAGRSISLLCLDEVDKYKTKTKQEAAAVQLAVQRTASFPMALIVQTSTPTTQEGSIWKAWLEGDQRRFWVPCPHCAKMTLLNWPMMKWDEDARLDQHAWDLKRVRETARLECPHCTGHLTDAIKTKMLREGVWRAENLGALPGHRSYHLSALYSVRRSFGALAVKFLQDKQSLMGLQDFVNSILAEPWEDAMTTESRPLTVGEYTLRAPAEERTVRFMAVDVQQDCFYFVCRAFAKDGSSKLIDEGRLTTWADLEFKVTELGLDTQRNIGGMMAKLVVVDSGFRTDEVLDVCIRNRYIPAKGEDRLEGYGVKLGKSLRKAISVIKPYRRGWFLMLFSSPTAQDVLEWLRSGQGPAWTVAADASEEYKAHLDAHRKVMRRSPLTGRETYLWKQIGRRPNHMLDAELMILALAEYGNIIKPSPPGATD